MQGAKIVATNIDTGVETFAETDALGVYAVSSIPIGSYRIEVQRDGFKKSVRGPVVLTIGKNAVEDLIQGSHSDRFDRGLAGHAPTTRC